MFNINIREIKEFCNTVFAGSLRKTQRENMGRAVAALLQGRDAHLSSIARSFEGSPSFKYRLKRFDRFIGNTRIKTWECFQALVPVILRLADRMQGYLPIVIDHTDVGADLRVLYAAVLFGRRALPLLFYVFNKRKVRHSQNKIEEAMLLNLKKMVPRRLHIVIVADRGFGRVSLFRFIENLKWHYVIRVKGTVTINDNELLRDARPLFFRKDVVYHKTARHVLHLVSITAGTDDPWYLATNMDDGVLVKSMYEKRMNIEELFRDQKWHVGMVVPTARHVGRFSRLLFIILLASLLLILLGKQIQKYPKLVRSIIADPRKAGLLWLAIQVLLHAPSKQVQILLRRTVRSLVLCI